MVYAVFFLGAAFGMSALSLLDMANHARDTQRITFRMALDAIIYSAIIFFTLHFIGSIN